MIVVYQGLVCPAIPAQPGDSPLVLHLLQPSVAGRAHDVPLQHHVSDVRVSATAEAGRVQLSRGQGQEAEGGERGAQAEARGYGPRIETEVSVWK